MTADYGRLSTYLVMGTFNKVPKFIEVVGPTKKYCEEAASIIMLNPIVLFKVRSF